MYSINTKTTGFYRVIELELSKDAKPLLKAKIFNLYFTKITTSCTARQTRFQIKSPYPSKRLFKTSLLMPKGSEKNENPHMAQWS